MHTPSVIGILNFFMTLGYISCMVVVSVSAKEEVCVLSSTIKTDNVHLRSHGLLKTPTHLWWQTESQGPRAGAWRKTRRTTEEQLVTWTEPLGRLQMPDQILKSSGQKEVIVMPWSKQVSIPTAWSAYLSPRPLRQVSRTRMPYVPRWRISQTRQIRWWRSWLHKLKWHLSSSCCGTYCTKTKQQAPPMPQTGSRISGWLHLSKPTRNKNMEIIVWVTVHIINI